MEGYRGGLGTEGIVDQNLVAQFLCGEGGFFHFLCGRIQQGDQVLILADPHMGIAFHQRACDIGDLVVVSPVEGGVAVCDIVQTVIAQIVRQVDHAVVTVDEAEGVSKADHELTVNDTQYTLGGSPGDGADGGDTVGRFKHGKILDGPYGAVQQPAACLKRGHRGLDHGHGVRGIYPVLHFDQGGKPGGGVAARSPIGDGGQGDPLLLAGYAALENVGFAGGFVPGQGVHIAALVRDLEGEKVVQQVLPDQVTHIRQIAVEHIALALPEGIKAEGQFLTVGGHGEALPFTERKHDLSTDQGGGQGAVAVFVDGVHPAVGVIRQSQSNIDLIRGGEGCPCDVLDLRSGEIIRYLDDLVAQPLPGLGFKRNGVAGNGSDANGAVLVGLGVDQMTGLAGKRTTVKGLPGAGVDHLEKVPVHIITFRPGYQNTAVRLFLQGQCRIGIHGADSVQIGQVVLGEGEDGDCGQ